MGSYKNIMPCAAKWSLINFYNSFLEPIVNFQDKVQKFEIIKLCFTIFFGIVSFLYVATRFRSARESNLWYVPQGTGCGMCANETNQRFLVTRT